MAQDLRRWKWKIDTALHQCVPDTFQYRIPYIEYVQLSRRMQAPARTEIDRTFSEINHKYIRGRLVEYIGSASYCIHDDSLGIGNVIFVTDADGVLKPAFLVCGINRLPTSESSSVPSLIQEVHSLTLSFAR
nr:hypothetical protein [Noviherbaspirillum aerium]